MLRKLLLETAWTRRDSDLTLPESALGADADAHAFTINAMRQKFAAICPNRGFHARPRPRIDQQRHATPAARAANFARQRALPARSGNNAVNHGRGDRRQVAPAKLPFLADEPAGLAPVVAIKREE